MCATTLRYVKMWRETNGLRPSLRVVRRGRAEVKRPKSPAKIKFDLKLSSAGAK
jgi:hypothetical protein